MSETQTPKVVVSDADAGVVDIPILPSNIQYLLGVYQNEPVKRYNLLWGFAYDRMRFEGGTFVGPLLGLADG